MIESHLQQGWCVRKRASLPWKECRLREVEQLRAQRVRCSRLLPSCRNISTVCITEVVVSKEREWGARMFVTGGSMQGVAAGAALRAYEGWTRRRVKGGRR